MRTTFWFAINALLAILTTVQGEVSLSGFHGFLILMASLFGLVFSVAKDIKEIVE